MSDWFNSYPVLAVLCVLGAMVSILKHWHAASQRGAKINRAFISAYFVDHWVETALAMIGAAAMFIIAASTGQLNVMAALTAGYTGNSLADLLSGNRGTRNVLTAGPPGRDGP